jgi:hypothetical protein
MRRLVDLELFTHSYRHWERSVGIGLAAAGDLGVTK